MTAVVAFDVKAVAIITNKDDKNKRKALEDSRFIMGLTFFQFSHQCRLSCAPSNAFLKKHAFGRAINRSDGSLSRLLGKHVPRHALEHYLSGSCFADKDLPGAIRLAPGWDN